ncbi:MULTISPECIES: Na+/H+ antiporter NhaA [unclassified Campylobacter]|uniref:Na+/H+ antiporter NhaA n=1 Tax=unclassified Campylobacter TaxID=2593542 RepID=UPI001238273D|nr:MULTISPECIES: Na+/H+ antiporter NhaA [unclassified Campylobacter]KAA6225093.1 Na+/H+ antiporter NhaA [Campylobacter sp. LR196d]KAA6226107.1 Na+/H+ antiporter NhaA [Campylobacter sp. LR185c]KAA6228054.1 Na+/H+ antiporter NhaA [Campylobacter sp. LR286c]KAA6231307.1 Na+/H+ antiporter NhaA [Campylobacter sp. LR264d]KAA6231519.1 Na+/H+ antiporter NhaA [Campylobacter sp. LR291e]
MRQAFKNLILHETFPGILLIFFTILALLCKNSSLSAIYSDFLRENFTVGFEHFNVTKPLDLWINDGLIAIFFLSIGLELKYEILRGQLKNIRSVSLPIFGALGGMIMPAVIFAVINFKDSFAMQGWAIPTATDIAFAVGILLLLGRRIPTSLKLFLLSLAIFDDLGAIIIIALFYTSKLSALALIIALMCIFFLFLLNYFHVTHLSLYVLVGVCLWVAMLKSGVHATLAGVIIALFIPLDTKGGQSYLHRVMGSLTPWVNYFILPLFAFANAGIDLRDMSLGTLFAPVSLGVLLGLFVGKQIGVFIFSYLAIKFKLAKMPDNVRYRQFYGICILTGIGFTMSLFIDALAYQNSDIYGHADRLAILLASFISAIIGYVYLKLVR